MPEMDQDKVKIKINIAGESMTLTVPFSVQDDIRDTERNVNHLFEVWRKRFPEKSDKEILAMVAFRFASYYDELLREVNAAKERTAEVELLLDRMVATPGR